MFMHAAQGRPRHRKYRIPGWELGVLAVLTVVLCGCGSTAASKTEGPGGGGGGKGGKGGGRGGDVPVTVANAKKRDVPLEVQVIGNVEAYSTITMKAQVSGQLTDVYFHEG